MFSQCTVPPNSKETKLGSSNQEASPSAGKNTRIVLVPCHTWKCAPTAISNGVDISKVPGCHLLLQMSSQWESQKLLQGLVSHTLTAYLSVFDQFLTEWIIAIFSKGCKPDKLEPHNSLKLSLTNIWGLRFNFVECESFLESNSPDILAICETNLDDSTDAGKFSVRGYLPLIQKDSISHVHGLAVYLKEGLPFAWDFSLENSADSYLCFRPDLLHSVSYFFFLYSSPSSLCMVFDSISSNIAEVLTIDPSAVFVFGDFNIHHKDWLTCSGGTDRPGELCYNFSISNDLTQMVNFPTRIPVLLFWISFFLLTLVFVLQWLSLHWEILIMLLS